MMAVNAATRSSSDESRGPLVVKLGGRIQSDPALPAALAALWTASHGRLVIVHGGGDQISALQRLRGEEPVFVGGRRVTTKGALELVRMVLSGLANKQLVSALTAVGAPAVGISGEDGALLCALPIDFETFGFAGTPTRVDTRLIETLLTGGFLPVISPVATDATSDVKRTVKPDAERNAHRDPNASVSGEGVERVGALNVNGDDAAAAIAAALGASELFLMIDVAGVLDADGERVPSLSLEDARQLIASGIAAGGMAAKLDASAQAIAGGVARVRIGDLAALTVADAGTIVSRS